MIKVEVQLPGEDFTCRTSAYVTVCNNGETFSKDEFAASIEPNVLVLNVTSTA